MTHVSGVSVVLPVFYRRVSYEETQLLTMALDSIISQRFTCPMEIVLVDDGSPDPVEALSDQLGSLAENIRWLRLPKNVGIVGALNAGIRSARFPLIARMDADDIWREGKIEAQIAQFEADPDLTICGTGMTRITTSGAELDTHIRPASWSGILRFFVEGGCPFPHGSVIARRDVYMRLGGYSHSAEFRHCEDYALWLIWLRFFKPAMIEKALYLYRVSNSSVSGVYAKQQSAGSQIIRRRMEALDFADTLPATMEALAKALNSQVYVAGLLCYTFWKYGGSIAVPEAALEPLARALPDKMIARCAEARSWRKVLGMPEVGGEKLIPCVGLDF